MSWRCKKVQDSLAPYLDGQLAPAKATAVEHHLANCTVCQDALAQIEQAAALLRAVPAVSAPISFAPRVKAHVRAVAAGPRSPLVRRGVLQGVVYGLVAGSVAAAALAFASVSLFSGAPASPGSPTPMLVEAQPPPQPCHPEVVVVSPQPTTAASEPAPTRKASRRAPQPKPRPRRTEQPARDLPSSALGPRPEKQEPLSSGQRPPELPSAQDMKQVVPGPAFPGEVQERAPAAPPVEERSAPGSGSPPTEVIAQYAPSGPRELGDAQPASPPSSPEIGRGTVPAGAGAGASAVVQVADDLDLARLVDPVPLPD